MDFLKGIAGKVVGGLVGLIVVAAALSWWQMDERDRTALIDSAGNIAVWIGLVLVLPWATFFLSAWASKFDSNAAGAALVLLLTSVEVAVLLWLFKWDLGGATAWTFGVLGMLTAVVYNVFTCDWLAERFG